MNPRFEENQPWNFGYTPSEYHETLKDSIKCTLSLNDQQLEHLDSIHNKTIECPAARELDRITISDLLINESIGFPCKQLFGFVASYTKPLSYNTYKNNEEQRTQEVLTRLGIKTKTIPAGTITSFPEHYNDFVASFSDELVELFIQNSEKIKNKEITQKEWHLNNGIMLGYPIAEVFGFAVVEEMNYPRSLHEKSSYKTHPYISKNRFRKNFACFPKLWSQEWNKNIGEDSVQHILATYLKYTPSDTILLP
jgi:hypothetical protein